mmetsp:Transcript_20357/g.36877  ORF Transcript_20357/g.36877 Transcript_20357/m.36877 type:complete len:95 (-) Transcript_20357:595-879(-)
MLPGSVKNKNKNDLDLTDSSVSTIQFRKQTEYKTEASWFFFVEATVSIIRTRRRTWKSQTLSKMPWTSQVDGIRARLILLRMPYLNARQAHSMN